MGLTIKCFPSPTTRLFLFSIIYFIGVLITAIPAKADIPGGLEQPTTAQIRAKLTGAQIQAMLPARGEFTFPAPYNTQGIRVTNSTDCSGADCVWPVGYSY